MTPSLEPSWRDGSNDGLQHKFFKGVSNMENYPKIIAVTPSYLEHCLEVSYILNTAKVLQKNKV